MPLIRLQIRNEYRLADPELYRATDKDDSEDLLEGVAMAGLLGVLRQVGDLADFAAEVFHGLHEEVMATNSRGNGLMGRVKQLEADFPSIEKSFLSQTDHSRFYYNKGADWHPNLCMDQNLVTRGDLPRFVMDSYEECRGPPQLFLLDKFDMAGAGACLKRYTDPSFFNAETTSSGVKEVEVLRYKKSRKVKNKGFRWKNGGAPEVVPTSHVKLHQLLDEERTQNCISVPAYHVTPRRRQLNGCPFDSKTGRSYMEKFLEDSSSGQEVIRPVPLSALPLESTSFDGTSVSSPRLQGTDVKLSMEDSDPEVVDKKDVMTMEDIENNGSFDDYHSNDVSSEVGNYVDAPPMMESEISSDSEYRYQNDACFSSVKKHKRDSDVNEETYDLKPQFSYSLSISNSSVSDGNNSSQKGRHSSAYSDTLSNFAENIISDGSGAASVLPPVDCVAETVCASSWLPVDETISSAESHGLAESNSFIGEDDAEFPSYRSEATLKEGISNGLTSIDEQGESVGDNLKITLHSVVSSEAGIHAADELIEFDNQTSVLQISLLKPNGNAFTPPSSGLIRSPSWNSRDIHETLSNSDSSTRDLEASEAMSPGEPEKQAAQQLAAAPIHNAASNDDAMSNISLPGQVHGPSSNHVDRLVDHDPEPESPPENPVAQVNQTDEEPKIIPLNDQSWTTCSFNLVDQERNSDVPSESCPESVPSPCAVPLLFQRLPGAKIGSSFESTDPSETIPSSSVQLPELRQVSLEEVPPLPPLPPLQWMTGKLPQFPKPSGNETINHALLSSEKDDGQARDSPNLHLPPSGERGDDNQEYAFRDSDENLGQPNQLELKILTGKLPQFPKPSDNEMINHALLSSEKDDGQAMDSPNRHLPPSDENLGQPNQLESKIFTTISNGDTGHDFPKLEESPPLNLPTSKLPMSDELRQNGVQGSAVQTIEGTAVEHSLASQNEELDQHLDQSVPDILKDEKSLQDSRCSGVDMAKSPEISVSTDAGKLQDCHLDAHTAGVTANMLAVPVDDKPNGKPSLKIPRRPDPLIEAVAVHDRTTMKKVPERVRHQTEPRDSVLEQIRAKSFNLRPASMARPSVRGPATNLKVAAILEKANAIRQAFAGSDEDDDADSWSDA